MKNAELTGVELAEIRRRHRIAGVMASDGDGWIEHYERDVGKLLKEYRRLFKRLKDLELGRWRT